MIENHIKFKDIIGSRLDPSSFKSIFQFSSTQYENVKLSSVAWINPSVKFDRFADSDEISFIPMEIIDEKEGKIIEFRTKKISESKGFTKFIENDLLWAKITPCMQNGKSAIAKNLFNKLGCGSTEFYVIRPKRSNILVEYLHFILRDKRVLEGAQYFFGGSAGQQRVSVDFIKNLRIPMIPLYLQEEIISIIGTANAIKQKNDSKAQKLIANIDNYILEALGISIPKIENTEENRLNTISISKLIGNRIDPYYNQKYFDLAFDSIHKSQYKIVSLKDLSLKITSGITPLSGGEAYTNEPDGIPFIRSGNIDIDGELNLEDLLQLKPHIHNTKMKSSQLLKGDIMIAIVGATIGQVGIYLNEREANINQAIALVRLKEGISRQYIKELIKSSIGQLNLNRLKRPVARANINLEEISTMQIVLPPLHKQEEIAQNILLIRNQAKQLQAEGIMCLEKAKIQVEKIILEGK